MTHEKLAVVARFDWALTMETVAPGGTPAPRGSPTASSLPPLAHWQLNLLSGGGELSSCGDYLCALRFGVAGKNSMSSGHYI
jgi:hypothetical protein